MARRNLGCGGTHKLLDRRFASSEECCTQKAAAFGELIAMGFGEFLDDTMGAQQTQLTTDAGGQSARVGRRDRAFGGIQEPAQVAVTEARKSELATADGLEQGEVLGVANAQCPHGPATIAHASANLVEELMQRRGIVDGGEGIEVALVVTSGGQPRRSGVFGVDELLRFREVLPALERHGIRASAL